MFKCIKWLFGLDAPKDIKKVKIVFLRGHDETRVGHADLLRRVNDLFRTLGYKVEPEDFWVFHYNDLQSKFDFKEPTKNLDALITEFANETADHVIIMHQGTCGYTWNYCAKLTDLFIKKFGKRSVCKIGYTHHHQCGSSYVIGKSKFNLVEPDIDIKTSSANFEHVKHQMFEGLGSR